MNRYRGTWHDRSLPLEERKKLYMEEIERRKAEPKYYPEWDSPIGGIGVAIGLCVFVLIVALSI